MPVGFHNLGFTCYFNALIQSLVSCDVFLAELKTIPPGKNAIVDLFNNNLESNSLAADIWRELIKKAPFYFKAGQQCASEGYTLLLDYLDKYKNIQKLFYHRVCTKIYCPECNNITSETRNMENVFITEYNLQCDQIVDFADAHIQPKTISEYISLNSGYVEGYKCEKCNVKSNKFKTNNLVMAPEILVINYKNYNKKTSNVKEKFPEIINLNGKKNKMTYNAVACIEHSGNVNGGHYWAICKRDDKWYNFNDMSVSPVGGFSPTNNTFMIFYIDSRFHGNPNSMSKTYIF